MHLHNYLQYSCIIICETAFYTYSKICFLGSLKNNVSRRGNTLRRKTSKKELSKNFTKNKLHVLNSSLNVFPSNRRIFKSNKIRYSKSIKARKLPSINFKWIILLVSIYVSLGLVLLIIQQFFDLIKDIIVYSLMGFFTFFMSYFGWRLAQIVKDIVRREVRKEHFEYQTQ